MINIEKDLACATRLMPIGFGGPKNKKIFKNGPTKKKNLKNYLACTPGWCPVLLMGQIKRKIWKIIWLHTRLMPRGGPVCPSCSQPTPLQPLEMPPQPDNGSQLQLTSGQLVSGQLQSSGPSGQLVDQQPSLPKGPTTNH